jgi:hypothetical protein
VSDTNDDPLEVCQEAVEELKAENADLRASAESFGALAERLNQARRTEPDSASETCPQCGGVRHVRSIEPTVTTYDRHCHYCGNSWRFEGVS